MLRSRISKKEPKTILVVDDDPDFTRLLRHYLELAEFRVLSAFSSWQCVGILEQYRPDLILLDLMMPSPDGTCLLRALSENADTATIPVVVLSGRIDVSARCEVALLGAVEHLTKPIVMKDLLARVETHLW